MAILSLSCACNRKVSECERLIDHVESARGSIEGAARKGPEATLAAIAKARADVAGVRLEDATLATARDQYVDALDKMAARQPEAAARGESAAVSAVDSYCEAR